MIRKYVGLFLAAALAIANITSCSSSDEECPPDKCLIVVDNPGDQNPGLTCGECNENSPDQAAGIDS